MFQYLIVEHVHLTYYCKIKRLMEVVFTHIDSTSPGCLLSRPNSVPLSMDPHDCCSLVTPRNLGNGGHMMNAQ